MRLADIVAMTQQDGWPMTGDFILVRRRPAKAAARVYGIAKVMIFRESQYMRCRKRAVIDHASKFRVHGNGIGDEQFDGILERVRMFCC